MCIRDSCCIPLGLLNRVPALTGWGKGGNVTSAGWQVILCDPIWHVSSRSGEACGELLYPVTYLLTYRLTVANPVAPWSPECQLKQEHGQSGRSVRGVWLICPEHVCTRNCGDHVRQPDSHSGTDAGCIEIIIIIIISARCNIYISRLCCAACQCLSVCLSVMEVHWGFKFRSRIATVVLLHGWRASRASDRLTLLLLLFS